MTIRIEDFDWTQLDGRTVNLTVQIKGDHVYVIEGQVVRVVDLSAGSVSSELPFFGPKSPRTGRLTEEQTKALDLLIREGYTAHRAAMLLGIHDSTVANRKKQLRSGSTSRAPRTVVTEATIAEIKRLRFDEGLKYDEIARLLDMSKSRVGYYVQKIEQGEYGGHSLALKPVIIENGVY